MTTFKLLGNKTRESINIVKTNTMEEAIEYFARVKSLPIDDLLEIYFVEEV